jgi:hypothetical protein
MEQHINNYKHKIYEIYKNIDKHKLNNYNLSKIFEYYVCIKLSEENGIPFYEYNDISKTFKKQNNMTNDDTGIDCSNLIDTIVQCKLRNNYSLNYRKCSTFFASQNIFKNGKTIIRWTKLIIARNSNSKLTNNLLMQKERFIDKLYDVNEMIKFCNNIEIILCNNISINPQINDNIIKPQIHIIKPIKLIKQILSPIDNPIKINWYIYNPIKSSICVLVIGELLLRVLKKISTHSCS